jgi:predicted adenylyl cyclase CyaB
MRHEIEVKLEIPNPRVLKRRLAELGFRAVRPRRFESNRLYDYGDSRLRKAGWVLRLRFIDDGHCFLTLKCGAVASRLYKIRPEIETEVKDGRQLAAILEGLGLRETFCYEKYRTVYGRKLALDSSSRSGQLAYDETPFGNFIELEGSKHWIDSMAREMGYQRADYITVGYPTLYSEWRRQNGRSGTLLSRSRRGRHA